MLISTLPRQFQNFQTSIPSVYRNDAQIEIKPRVVFQNGSLAIDVFNSLVRLSNLISVVDFDRIYEYLLSCSNNANDIEILSKRIFQSFQNKVHITLELRKFYESDDGYLTLNIRLREYPENIMEIIDEFGNSINLLRLNLFITTDFKFPD